MFLGCVPNVWEWSSEIYNSLKDFQTQSHFSVVLDVIMYVKVVKNEQETFCEGVALKTVTGTEQEEARMTTTDTRVLLLSWSASKQ